MSQNGLDYFQLRGEIALITGASSGIGAHAAQTLAQAGCTVILAARRVDRLQAVAASIARDGGIAHVVAMDVTDTMSVQSGIDWMLGEVGCPSVLVNNAGIARQAPFLEAEDADTDAVVAVNQTAVWRVAQRVCRAMVSHAVAGRVIHVASILASGTTPGVASYAMTKASVAHLTHLMALELARHGIRVNALAPGYVKTEINAGFLDSDAGQKILRRVPLRRAVPLAELDAPLLLLASPRNAMMTGVVLPVDGGHLVAGL